MRANESDIDDPVWVIDGDDKTVQVTLYVEYHAIVGDKAGSAVVSLDITC